MYDEFKALSWLFSSSVSGVYVRITPPHTCCTMHTYNTHTHITLTQMHAHQTMETKVDATAKAKSAAEELARREAEVSAVQAKLKVVLL